MAAVRIDQAPPVAGVYPLEPSPDDMRTMGEAALNTLIDYIARLDDLPAFDLSRAREAARDVRERVPDSGRDFSELLRTVVSGTEQGIKGAGPGFMGYIPGGGLYASALAALLGFGLNQFVTIWEASPVFAQIEETVVRWMCDMFAYPPESEGILTSGGSMANFSAIVTARKALLPSNFLAGTLYTSEQAHHSVAKAAMLAGFPRRNVRLVPTTPELRVDVDALARMIDSDRRAGMTPFCIVAHAGTTNTGTVDALAELVTMAHFRHMWLHVDAAYGGFFWLTQRGQEILRGIVGADSITLDPHKGLFLPFGVGALIVRDGGRLRDAHRLWGDYLQDRSDGDADIPNFTDYSPELSRDFRGLRVWLPIELHGLNAFREALDEKLVLARHAYERLRAMNSIEVPWEPDLSVVAFRSRHGDEASRVLLERVNASGRVFLSSTQLRGQFFLRIAILSHRTHRNRVDEALDIVERAGTP